MIFAITYDPVGMGKSDLPFALIFFTIGAVLLVLKKQQAAARLERVKKGEITAIEAKQLNRICSLGGYVLIAIGVILALTHYYTF